MLKFVYFLDLQFYKWLFIDSLERYEDPETPCSTEELSTDVAGGRESSYLSNGVSKPEF